MDHIQIYKMNPSSIFCCYFLQALKAVVPNPILKNCLDDMVRYNWDHENPFDTDHDDDAEEFSEISKFNLAKKFDIYDGSILLKSGRTSNNTLYFTNYDALPNNGYEMKQDERNLFKIKLHTVKRDEESMKNKFDEIEKETRKLHSEPTNEVLDMKIYDLEKFIVVINSKLDELREYEENEKKKIKIQKSINRFSTFWRKRRKLTIDFLIMMEECTDGSVTVKKCLKGDSPIEIESDESHLQGALEWAKMKRQRQITASSKQYAKKRKKYLDKDEGFQPDQTFVGMKLDMKGNCKRVYSDD